MQRISKLLCFVFTFVLCLNITSPAFAATLNQKEALQTKLHNINQQIQTLEKESQLPTTEVAGLQRKL